MNDIQQLSLIINLLFCITVNAEESGDMTKVIVKLVIPDLTIEKKIFGSAKPKTGESEVTVKFDSLYVSH